MTPVWTTSRASGLAALMTASLAISCGLLMALRIPALRRRAPELRAAHQALANATFALIGVHAVSLLLDPVLRPGLAGLLVPFAAPYRPLATALGRSPPTACSRWVRRSMSAGASAPSAGARHTAGCPCSG